VLEWCVVQPVCEQRSLLSLKCVAVEAREQHTGAAAEVERTHCTATQRAARELRRREFDLAQRVSILLQEGAHLAHNGRELLDLHWPLVLTHPRADEHMTLVL